MTDDDRSVLAAEYVLGLATPEERAQVERDLPKDFELRRAVAFWQDRLLPMTRVAEAADPSAAVWTRIEASLAQRDQAARVATPPPAPRHVEPARAGWWESLALWRGVGLVATLALLIALGTRFILPAAAPERYLAVLQNEQKTAGWIVEVQAGGTLRLVPLARTEVPPQRALQFWTKAESATAPTSLGLVPGDRPTVIAAARLPAVEANQLFELTLEPEGGSPIGRPTGPILFLGRTVAMK